MNSKEIICPFDPIIVHRVKYLCSCGLPQPLSKLYFCRHCLDLRCGFCVLHEVDSHYCPNCLENMPSAEARLKKNRCANCFDCPSCGHTLSTRASSMPIKAPTEDGNNISIRRIEKEKEIFTNFFYNFRHCHQNCDKKIVLFSLCILSLDL